ncbi:hypothetical protein G7Y89_g9454 [Cudoniella acicularis]|uniref:Solute carrier family 40 member n=1 Tax=Cudoniella acicularis TaxID=354080 RepID=A0A8H4RIB9_9HELO|nr:hypothetical protein G7Y89_g9454 [Cudoniella acicularis]
MSHDVQHRRLSTSSTRSADAFLRRHDVSAPRADGTEERKKSGEEVNREFEAMSESSDEDESTISHPMDKWKWWKVYAMHFLFTWNSRTYEYVSIFLVALAFPKSLTATSIRGLASTISALICSSAVGSWIDRSPSRLRTLLITICLNHGAMVLVYLCWLSWPFNSSTSIVPETPFSDLSKGFLFGLILFLDIIHDLSAIGNRLSVERDWVPVLVGPVTAEMQYSLTDVNAVMVRLDLACKLIAPSLLPLIVKTFPSQSEWIFFVAILTIVFWIVELWCATVVAKGNTQLQLPKRPFHDPTTTGIPHIDIHTLGFKPGMGSWPGKIYQIFYLNPAIRLKGYFSVSIWPASISIALLQLTVLAYSATLITYLLEIGFSLTSITIARASGAILALASTVITPAAATYMRNHYSWKVRYRGSPKVKDIGIERRVVRKIGFWGVLSQFICLIPVVLILFILSPANTSSSPHTLLTLLFFASLSLSRIGHYANLLMVQELGQVEIPLHQRSTFAGTEQSFKSACELCHWAATVLWSKPEDFRWLALGSLLVTGTSAGVFGAWVRGGNSREVAVMNGGYEGIPMGTVGILFFILIYMSDQYRFRLRGALPILCLDLRILALKYANFTFAGLTPIGGSTI